jgi:hypothetical protein
MRVIMNTFWGHLAMAYLFMLAWSIPAFCGEPFKLSDYPPLGFAVFGGAGVTNQSGNAAHGSVHLGADFEIGN